MTTFGFAELRKRQVPLNADYTRVCKFESTKENNYKQVFFNLVRLVNFAINTAAEKERITLLSVQLLRPLFKATWTRNSRPLRLLSLGR